MANRPKNSKQLDYRTFRSYYYLKEELVDFCRENGLPVSGAKTELTDRIAYFLETGEILPPAFIGKKASNTGPIRKDMKIESDFVCSQRHRAFFKEHIGKSFSFNVNFQKWLKSNAGKTYQEAISAYGQILKEKKKGKTEIDQQFEYNTYIRAFFTANKGKSLEEAIRCWNYKKQLPGHNRYEKSDLLALDGDVHFRIE